MAGESSPAHRYCTVCGARSPSASTFCGKCGRVLEVPSSAVPAYCRDCGSEVSLGDAYCAHCGAPQSPRAPALSQPPPPKPASPPSVEHVDIIRQESPDLAVRVVWFVFAGFWFGLVVSTIAWMFIVTIVGMPIGIWLVHRIPAIMTLRSRSTKLLLGSGPDGRVVVREERPVQLPFGTRALYFVTIGWWASLFWLILAWILAIMIIPLPVAMWMYDRLPLVTTLEKY